MAGMQIGHGNIQSGVYPDGAPTLVGHTAYGQAMGQPGGPQQPLTATGGQVPPSQQQQQPQQAPASKELNAAMLCRFGQETVQEIVGRSLEMFQLLRATQPPDGKTNNGMERKTKFQETLKNLKAHFKRLRVIYEKIEENFPSSRDIPFEEEILSKGGDDTLAVDDKRNTESYKQAVEEYKETMEQVIFRNRQLKDTIDHLRTIIWDVNTMIAMRKDCERYPESK